jgi:hypothetical protein
MVILSSKLYESAFSVVSGKTEKERKKMSIGVIITNNSGDILSYAVKDGTKNLIFNCHSFTTEIIRKITYSDFLKTPNVKISLQQIMSTHDIYSKDIMNEYFLKSVQLLANKVPTSKKPHILSSTNAYIILTFDVYNIFTALPISENLTFYKLNTLDAKPLNVFTIVKNNMEMTLMEHLICLTTGGKDNLLRLISNNQDSIMVNQEESSSSKSPAIATPTITNPTITTPAITTSAIIVPKEPIDRCAKFMREIEELQESLSDISKCQMDTRIDYGMTISRVKDMDKKLNGSISALNAKLAILSCDVQKIYCNLSAGIKTNMSNIVDVNNNLNILDQGVNMNLMHMKEENSLYDLSIDSIARSQRELEKKHNIFANINNRNNRRLTICIIFLVLIYALPYIAAICRIFIGSNEFRY